MMDDRLESTVEAMVRVYILNLDARTDEHIETYAMRKALQAAFDDGGVISRTEYDELMERKLEMVRKRDSLREAAQAVYDIAERDTEIFRRLRRELERA